MSHKWLFAVLAVWFVSCEEEPPPIKFTEKPLLDTVYQASAPSAQTKKILLSDITGVRCNNCPRAAELAKKISADNPNRIEIIALYPNAGTLTFPWDGYDTLNTTDADQLIGTKPSSLPVGMVDNISYNGSVFIGELAWAAAVNQQLPKTTPVNIQIKTSWLNAEDKARLEVKAIANTAANINTKWIFAVVEDDIKGKQSDSRLPSGYDEQYKHSHVLRQVVGSPFGDPVFTGMVNAGATREKHVFIPRNKKWNADNLHIMVWVMDATPREVLHVESAKLKP